MRGLKALESRLNANTHFRTLKNLRNTAVDRYFRARFRDKGRAFANELRAGAHENICFVVAFNTPWVIDAMGKAWSTFSADMKLVVVDNSSSPVARSEIERICGQRGISYFAMPPNPEWNPCRSHGIALNWIYYNIVRRVRPARFGFLDHDCIPITQVDIPNCIGGRSVYGLKYQTKRDDGAWYLWAGFCFFTYASVAHVDLDFKHRIEFGMDTGGSNWPLIYRDTAPADAGFVLSKYEDATIGGHKAPQQIIDGSFLHVGGASYNSDLANMDTRSLLQDHIWESYLGGAAGRTSAV